MRRNARGAALLVVLVLGLVLAFAESRSSRDEAVSLAIAGDYEKAYQIFRALLREAPEDPLLNYYAGATCVRMNKLAEGIGYLEGAVRQKAPFPQAYEELAEAYLKKKLNSQARDLVEKGLSLFPKNRRLRDLQIKIKMKTESEALKERPER